MFRSSAAAQYQNQSPDNRSATAQTANNSTPSDGVGYGNIPEGLVEKKIILAKQIIGNFESSGVKAVILDFDGTVTKLSYGDLESRIAASSSSSSGPDNYRDVFADFTILQHILEEGKKQGIEFYIASRNSSKTIKAVLGDLADYFIDIKADGTEESKKQAIIEIAQSYKASGSSVLYLDDSPEINEEEKKELGSFIMPNYLDPVLPSSDPKSIHQEPGLTYESWNEINDFLVLSNDLSGSSLIADGVSVRTSEQPDPYSHFGSFFHSPPASASELEEQNSSNVKRASEGNRTGITPDLGSNRFSMDGGGGGDKRSRSSCSTSPGNSPSGASKSDLPFFTVVLQKEI